MSLVINALRGGHTHTHTQTHANIYGQKQLPYKWIYWRVEYLAICLQNSVGVILIWRNVAKWEIN